MQWILPSLNVNELTGMFMGMKKEMPPHALEQISHIAEKAVDPEKWNAVKSRVGL